MRAVLFATRNTKEILRDPLNLFFGLGFPLVLLGLLTMINAQIPPEAGNPMFEIENLAPGLAMFGTTFMALFAGQVLAKDRSSSFLMRLFTSPMTARDFLLGYTMPMVVIAVGQATITLLVALLAGLDAGITILGAILVTGVVALLFVGLGLLCGSLVGDKAVGGLCGALLTNVAGWLSGVFIPLDVIGGPLRTIAHALPFYHAVQAIKLALDGAIGAMLPHLGIVLASMAVAFALAVLAFRRAMRGDHG